MIKLYENIKRFREEMGMSQESLAKLTGYSDRSSITKIEKGQVDLQQSKIELFAKALDVSVNKLVGWDNDSLACNHCTLDESPHCDIFDQCHKTGARQTAEMYTHLDDYDRGTITGEMRQMLKDDKYDNQEKEPPAI